MAGRLEGRIAVITGAGSGMGRAMAELFAAEGAKLVCADLSGRQEQVAASIGPSAVPVHADVSRAEDVRAMIAAAEDRFGRLDILCNNAGVAMPELPFHEVDEELFDTLVAVNLRGVFLGMKYGIAAMLKTGGGAIVNTASAAALAAWKHNSGYGAAKAGVIQLTKCAALDYATRNIRVNAICPGITWTGMVPGSGDSGEAPPNAPVPPGTPMERWARPYEMAATALFLASDEASFITGAAVPVDGGYVAG
jgi:NAD(P)-dependent dehydrogenase (short-subunit alcohol dehydrogenase family)